MDLIVKSKIEPKIEFLPIENLTKITCPRNSEGTINVVVDIEYNLHLLIEENAHWTINVEYPKGYIKSNNNIDINEYASLKHNIFKSFNAFVISKKYLFIYLLSILFL